MILSASACRNVCLLFVLNLPSAASPQPSPLSGNGLPLVTSVTETSGFAGRGLGQASWIEIHGTNLAQTTAAWQSSNFSGGTAPQVLGGVTVTIGAKTAFLSFVSPNQVDALLPSNAPTGTQNLTITNESGTSAPYSVTLQPTAPALWSPANFNIGGIQYVGAVFPDLATLVLPDGAIPGIASRPAAPGDSVILFGGGFGPVTPDVPAGQIVTQTTRINSPVLFSFGQTVVVPNFAGLALNQTGLYQFNLKVPAGVGGGAVPLGLSFGGTVVPQTANLKIALTETPDLQLTGIHDLAGNTGVATPGGILIIDGSGFASSNASAQYPLQTQLLGIYADFEGVIAPIASVTPQEIQLQVPWELLGRSTATLNISNWATGAIASIAVALQTAAPGVASAASGLSIQIEGSGGASPAPVTSSGNNRPVLPGEFLDIPAVGLGIQKDGPADGQPASGSNPGNPLRGVMVKIGSSWAPVSSAALVPGRAGVSLVRVQVPVNAPVGDAIPLVLEAWGVDSSPVQIAVGPSPSAVSFQVLPADGTFGSIPAARFPLALLGAGVTASAVTWTAEAMNAPMLGPVSQPGTFGTTASGVYYTGPYNAGLPEYMLIRATLNSDPTIFATARVLVTQGTPSFHITPRDRVIGPSDSVTFQAVDDSDNPVQVNWYLSSTGGNIYSNVFQPEPYAVDDNPVVVRAFTNGDAGAADQTLLYVVPSEPKITSLSPPNPSPGEAVVIATVNLQVRDVTVYFSRFDGSRVAAHAVNGNNQVAVLVPPDAVEGPIEIDAQPVNSAPIRSKPYQAAISPKLRLHPKLNEIAQGESTTIDVAFLFDPRMRPLQWSTTSGSIDSLGHFNAPGFVQQLTYARISACLTDRNICGYTVVAVQPFRVEPVQPAVAAGSSLRLQAVASGVAIQVAWQVLGVNATIDANGNLTASSGPLDGGVARVRATSASGVTRVIEVAITGTQGGMVTVSRDFLNWADGVAFGTACNQIAVIGKLAYSACTNMPDEAYVPGYEAFWLDTWDVTDPFNPIWQGSTGIPATYPASITLTKLEGSLLVRGNWSLSIGGSASVGSIALVYDIKRGMPFLSTYATNKTQPQGVPLSVYGNTGYTISGTHVFAQDLSTLAWPTPIPVQLPAAFSGTTLSTSVVGNGQTLYVAYTTVDEAGQLLTYDLTVSPPALLDARSVTSSDAVLHLLGEVLLCGEDVYTLAQSIPQFASHLPILSVQDTDVSRLRVLGRALEGMRIVDVTDPHNPRISAPAAFLNLAPPAMALATGDSFLAANQELETLSIPWTSGPQYLASFGGSAIAWDQKTRGNLVFLAESVTDVQGGTYDPRIFKVYDLTNAANPQLIGHYDDSTQSANALALRGNNAFLECDKDFVVLDISNPAAPVKISSMAAGGYALAVTGNHAFLGTFSGNTPVLMTVDVSNPISPVVAGQTNLANPAYYFALNGNTLAVASGSAGLYLYDVTNPAAPTKIWNSTDGAPAWAVAWSGTVLYTASGSQGLIVRDASNPRAPTTLGSNGLGGYSPTYMSCCDPVPTAITVFVSGGVAWVGTTDSNAAVFGLDVRDPANPRVIHLIRYGNAAADQGVTSIGLVGADLLIGGNYQSLTSMNLLSITPPGNVIRAAPVQTVPGDFQPPLQLTPIEPVYQTNIKQLQTVRKPGAFLQQKLKHIPEPFRERELRALGLVSEP